jgi:hypothetical protein
MIPGLPCRVSAVMAIEATRDDIRVIKIRGRPGDRGVAIIAIVTTLNMRPVFSDSNSAVMTR